MDRTDLARSFLDDLEWTAYIDAEFEIHARDSRWKDAEVARCFGSDEINSWDHGFLYWASRHWRLVNMDGREILFRPRALQSAYLNHRAEANIILKARKRGASTVIDALYYWRAIKRPHQQTFIVAHILDSTSTLWTRVTFAHHRMRPWIALKSERSNRRELLFSNGSAIFVMTAGSKGVGRAADADAIHLSEFAFYPDADSVMLSLGEAQRRNAWVDVESTANGFDPFRALYYQAAEGGSPFKAHFFPWWIDGELRAPLIGGERWSAEELALPIDDEQRMWRRLKREALGPMFAQEYPEDDASCFLVSGLPIFDVDVVRDLLREVETSTIEISTRFALGSDNGRLKVWRDPIPGHEYVIGADVAEGIPGRAYSVAAVLDVSLDIPEQAAEWHGHIGPVEFGRDVLAPLGRFFNDAVVAPERNNHGHATIAGLKQAAYPRIYHHRRPESSGGQIRIVGWPTDGGTKPVMIGELRACVRERLMVFHSADFLREAMHFQSGDEDEEAPGGGRRFTDRVIAWSIAWQVRRRVLSVPVVV